MAETVSFGNWIRQRRRALDLTQDQLAARVGCSISAIRKIEADERRPSRQVAELLADTLQIPTTERATFLKVARMELSFERLETIDAPAMLTLAPPLLAPAREQASLVHATNGGAARPTVTLLNLPRPPTPLVGREVEVARIAEILSGPECRLLTLTGPGGIGKTRLAIAAAASLAESRAASFADGACFVPLAVVTAAESIWAAMAGALGLQLRNTDDPKAQLATYLHAKHLLLVLDNLEHLLEGVAIIADILQGAAGVRVLATSRERLGLSGEWVMDIHGLGVPAPAPEVSDELPHNWERSSAIVLFLQAARRANPEFVLRAADYPAVAQICQTVEGIPLGIELAAAWVRMLTCDEIASEIERSFDLLATSARDVPQRQRSLRAAFEHSWRLLPADERAILQALSVFSGGFTRKAAEAVASASLLSLGALMAKSLAVRADDGRYDLHEMVRQYAAEKLGEAGEVAAIRRRHWQYFMNLAQAADAARNSPQHMALVDQLALENDNLQSALAYLMDNELEEAWRFAGLLEAHWYRRPVRESEHWLTHLVDMSAQAGYPVAPALQARVRLILTTFQTTFGDSFQMLHEVLALACQGNEQRVSALALALLGNEGILGEGFTYRDAYFAEAQRLAEEMGDKATLTTVLVEQGNGERYQGRYAWAAELYAASVSLAQEIGRTDLIVDTLTNLAKLALRQGDPQKALVLIEPTLPVWQTLHQPTGLADAQTLVARGLTVQGDYDHARAVIDEAEANFRNSGAYAVDDFVAMLRGQVEYALGRVDTARQLYERAIALYATSLNPTVITLSQLGLAWCALRQGDLACARTAIERGRQVCDATHERWVRALLEFASGQLAWLSDDQELAEQCYRMGLQQVLRLGDRCAIAEALEHWGLIHVASGRSAHAARLFAAAGALRRQIGAPLPPIDHENVENGVAAARYCARRRPV